MAKHFIERCCWCLKMAWLITLNWPSTYKTAYCQWPPDGLEPILLGPLPLSSLRVILPPAMPSTASAPIIDHPSVFDVLNLFRACWFLNREHLLSLILAAVKGGDNNNIMWIDLIPNSHTHLLRQAKALAPPSYPLSLLKRVMFTFLLEVVNSHGSPLDKFIKTLAPRQRCAVPAPARSSPPTGSANPGSRCVQDDKAQHSGTPMPVAPIVVDPPPPSMHPASLSPLPGIAAVIFKPGASSVAPQSNPYAMPSATRKHGLSPPTHPISSPPPAPYMSVENAPPDWWDWITYQHSQHFAPGTSGPSYVLDEDL